MLNEKEIDSEIARLEYVESSYSNYAKLADLYIIRGQMNQPEESRAREWPEYSYDPPAEEVFRLYGGSEFLQTIEGRRIAETMEILGDLLETLRVVNPKVYLDVMRRIKDV